MGIYLDNGATSYPKPKSVEETLIRSMTQVIGNVGRTSSAEVHTIEHEVYNTRALIARFFEFEPIDHVVFTKNITESINLFLNGFLSFGDKVIYTGIEHNAVARPIEHLKSNVGIIPILIGCDGYGQIDLNELEVQLKLGVKLVVASHASNVTGDIQQLEAMGQMCKAYDAVFMVDAAQSAGVIPISMKEMHIDVLCITGHKSLLGPQGIGAILIEPSVSKKVKPLIYGGTGSLSESLEQPELMPDKFESGTQNISGILGLGAAIHWLSQTSLKTHLANERKLIDKLQIFLDEQTNCIRIGNPDAYKRLPVLSFYTKEKDISWIAYELSKDYGIQTRVGLHCAPLAHKTYGTYPYGTIRISPSKFTTEEEINQTIEALSHILR